MFSQTTWYRRGFNPGECATAPATARMAKRGAMSDLVKGTCPDVTRQAALIQDVFKESPESLRDKPLNPNGAAGLMVNGAVVRSAVCAFGVLIAVQWAL
jgi:hypothetical protein